MAETATCVLLIDDDERLQANAREFLESFGYRLESLYDGRNIVEQVANIRPDIILLDVMLPGDDGLAVLQQLRSVSRIPVIMLTARGDDTDRILGLEMGADDYLPKPYNPRELIARIKAVLRRTPVANENGSPDAQAPGLLTVGPVTLDVKRQTLACNEKSVTLTTTEFRIIQVFMSRAGEVLSRDDLLTLVFGQEYYGSDRSIDVYVSRVRNTIKAVCEDTPLIQTVWGTGYRWIKDD